MAANISVRFDVDLKIDQAALNFMLKSPHGLVGEYIYRMGLLTTGKARQRAPVRTGALKSSIRMTRGADGIPTAVEITANIEYALAVHQGSRPHVISARDALVLRFPSKSGTIIYAPRVNHPGNKPNPFLWDALLDVVAAMA